MGVQRQYCGALGKIGNCHVAVSSALVADGRTWPLACDLYIPVSWTEDASRRAAASIPPTLRLRETWRIALAQLRTILQAGFTVTGVVIDADDGTNALAYTTAPNIHPTPAVTAIASVPQAGLQTGRERGVSHAPGGK